MFEEKLREFELIFYPRSIAVVGASASEMKAGSMWLKGLISAGFKGPIYPVSSSGGTICGLKIFPSLRSVPGDVDYVVVSIPRQSVLELLDDCVAKKVKAVHFFTAGFSETGESQWREMEEQMVRRARRGGVRIIGPNCLGIYNPESKVSLGPSGEISEAGSVAFISQSGGVADKLVKIGIARHIHYSKGVSFGNAIDLDASDFLQYLAADTKTAIIGAYLEGTRNGQRLFHTMKKVAKSKPLIVWKAGRTEIGARAAMSHTGSLASSADIWSAVLKQAGAIEAHSLDELADALLIFQQLGHWKGSNIAVIGGLADGGGGISVSAGDACSETGLNIPLISQETRRRLAQLLGEVGSILSNPIDVSQAFGQPNILSQIIDLIAVDSSIELILIQEDVDLLLSYGSYEQAQTLNDIFVASSCKHKKPLVVVLPPGSAEPERLSIERKLLEASIPVFPTMERAAKAIVKINKYFSSRK